MSSLIKYITTYYKVLFLLIVCFVSIETFGITPSNVYFQEDAVADESNEKSLFIGITSAFNINQFNKSLISSEEQWGVASGFSFVPSIHLLYMLSQKIGIGIGLSSGSFTAGFDINSQEIQFPDLYQDIDEDLYHPIYENSSFKEVSTYRSIDIPVYLTYKHQFSKFNGYLNLGIIYSTYSNITYTLEGTTTRKGYYPDYSVILYDVPEYGFNDIEYSPSDQLQLEAPSSGISALISFGVLYDLSQKFSLKLGINRVQGLTNLQGNIPSDFESFHSSAYLDKIKYNATGVEVGLYYKFR